MKITKGEAIKLAVVLAMTLIASYNFIVFELTYSKKPPIAYTYVGDEVWYVSASRNILREVFHLFPPCSIQCNATVQFADKGSELRFLLKTVPKLKLSVLYNYTKVKNALYIEGPKGSIEKLIKNKELYNITVVQPGWKYPEQQGILKYLNLEHPPLGKYFIGLAILEKDVPWMWRRPGIILSTVAFFTLTLASYLATGSLIMWITTLMLLYFDIPLRVMSMVAMLDIYSASFSMLAISALPFSVPLSVVMWSLATSSKYTAAFYLIPLAYVFWKRGDGILEALLKPATVALATFLLLSLPLILHLGPFKWLDEVIRGLTWFTVSRPAGPPVSGPWEWMMGKGVSPLYINPALYVTTNAFVMLTGIASFFLLYPLKEKRPYKLSWIAAFFLISSLLGFQLLYLKGNRTLYAFYTVVFTPMADVAAAGIVALLSNLDDLGDSINWWMSVAVEVAKWLWGTKRLKCELVSLENENTEEKSESSASDDLKDVKTDVRDDS